MKSFFKAASILVVGSLLGCQSLSSAWGPFGLIDARSQKFVDAALQGEPDVTVLPHAAVVFQRGCDAGDAAACSLLGVMHERGLVVQQSMSAARELYSRACQMGNRLGCAHLFRDDVMSPSLAPILYDATAER